MHWYVKELSQFLKKWGAPHTLSPLGPSQTRPHQSLQHLNSTLLALKKIKSDPATFGMIPLLLMWVLCCQWMLVVIWLRRFWVRRRMRMEVWDSEAGAAATVHTSATTTSRRRTCRTLRVRECWVTRRLWRWVGRWQPVMITLARMPCRHLHVGSLESLPFIRSIVFILQLIQPKVGTFDLVPTIICS